MSKLERINTFISVVEENGFAASARKHGVSTAAISRQISALEAELGVQLLTRTTRQVRLTETGLQYYQQCKKALGELAEAENAIAGSQQEALGVLNILSPRYFALTNIIPRLPEFMARNPKLRINFELAERFPDFSQEGIDILFGVTIEGPPGLVRRRVATTRYVLCASPSYLKNHGMPKAPADLQQYHYIAHSMRKPLDILTFNDGKEVYLEPIVSLNDTRAMRECALQGMGIVKLHDYEVADALADGSLREILTEFRGPQYTVYLYYQQSRYLQPKIRRFIDFFIS